MQLFELLAEDDEFLVVNKPAGLVCHPTKGDEYSSLISRARLYLQSAESPHLINRLDRETSGVVILAKQVEAGAALRKLWAAREVHKEYLAVVHGTIARAFTIDAPLGEDADSEIAIKDRVAENGAPAVTHIFPLRRFSRGGKPFTVVRVHPITGRKHQIRIHLSHSGHPIVGDKIYGGNPNLYLAFVRSELTQADWRELMLEHHALHAGLVAFHWRGVLRTYACQPEPWFNEFART